MIPVHKKAILTFHQCWTDVINSLPLVDVYKDLYEELIIVCRKYPKDMVNFYIRNKPTVRVIYPPTDDIDSVCKQMAATGQYDTLLHGFHDESRNDHYCGIFSKIYLTCYERHFVKLFYELYDVPYINRINSFIFERDIDSENRVFNSFVELHNSPSTYGLYHSDVGDRSITFNKNPNLKYFNLNTCSTNPFIVIKLLETAKELHLVDSFWASFCYMLNAKYGLLKDIPIFLYPFPRRSGGCCKYEGIQTTVLEPVSLPNWEIVR